MPAPTSTRSARCSTGSPCRAGTCEFEDGLRGGVACTRAVVGGDDVVVRTHGAIAALIDAAALPARVTERALAVFRALAAVESALHRRPIDQVHFHEVGGHDAIIDIVGTAAALEVLGVDEVVRLRRGHRDGHGAQRPRPAAQSRAGDGPPARGRSRPTAATSPSSSPRRPAPRCWPPCPRRSAPSPPWRSPPRVSAAAPARWTTCPTAPRS